MRFAPRARLQRRADAAAVTVLHQFARADVSSIVEAGHIEAEFIAGTRQEAPVLVFLHEGLGSVSMWRGFPQRIAVTTGCSALVYSRYGNGFSDVLTGPRTVSYMHDEARALPEILDRYEIAEAILVGHSDGASIALIYAGENGARVRAIVAEAPHVFVEDRSIEGIVRAKAEYERGGLRAKLSRYHRDVDRTFYGWNDVWLSTGFRIWNIRGAVRNVRVPMLLVQGRDDEYGTREQLHAICEDARGPVDVLYLAHCGHSPHRSRAELVTAAVSSFIAETLE